MRIVMLLLAVGCAQPRLECGDLNGIVGACGGWTLRHCIEYPSKDAAPSGGFLAHINKRGDTVRTWECSGATCVDRINEATCTCLERDGQEDACELLEGTWDTGL